MVQRHRPARVHACMQTNSTLKVFKNQFAVLCLSKVVLGFTYATPGAASHVQVGHS